MFRTSHSLHERWNESKRVLEKYPDKVPIICEKSNITGPDIDKKKYLVSRDLTIGQFIYVIRKRLKLSPEKAIFLFINGSVPPTSQFLGTLYEFNKENDNFLYILYSFENTFG